MKLNQLAVTTLEKAAQDNGFDLGFTEQENWLCFSSSRCPLKIWLTMDEKSKIVVAFSSQSVAESVLNHGMLVAIETPQDANSAMMVSSLASLHQLLKRAYQLSRALPNEPLIEFQKRIYSLPHSTEIERMVIQRVGQDIFRERLFEFWDGKCAVTGLAIPALLKASHIKPWKDCATDSERLDVYNGLLLAPHFDAVFDRGFISFGDDGALIASSQLGSDGLKILGIEGSAKVSGLTSSHLKYLAWHRAKEFKGA